MSFRKGRGNLPQTTRARSQQSEKPILTLNNVNTDMSGSTLRFVKNSSNPSGSVSGSVGYSSGDEADILGTIDWWGQNVNVGTPAPSQTAKDKLRYGRIRCESTNVQDGSENGSIIITTKTYGDMGGTDIECARTNPMVGTTPGIGFGHRRPAVNVTSGTTLTIMPEHSGMMFLLRNAFSSDLTITLPDDNGLYTGIFYTIFIGVDITGDLAIQTAASGDLFLGAIRATSTTANKTDIFPVVVGDAKDKLLFDADTKGRLAGSVYHFTLVGSDKWLVEGHALTTGASPANPWSTI
jgi:hypothetical protein